MSESFKVGDRVVVARGGVYGGYAEPTVVIRVTPDGKWVNLENGERWSISGWKKWGDKHGSFYSSKLRLVTPEVEAAIHRRHALAALPGRDDDWAKLTTEELQTIASIIVTAKKRQQVRP